MGSTAVSWESIGRAFSAQRPDGSVIQYARKTLPPPHLPAYRGKTYEANVPDTMDLAERARILIEGVATRACDPDYDFETYQEADFSSQPAYMYHSFHDYYGSEPKFLEALPLLRSITGSDVNLHVDHGMYRAVLRMIGEDGLTWVPVKGRPWAFFDCWNSRPMTLPPADVEQIFSLWPHGRTLLAACT